MPETQILLVDDDDQFSAMLQKIIIEAGYTISRAHNGKEALQLYNTQTSSLVLTDMIMPDMEGVEFIIELRKRCPGVKVIAMSGGGRNNPAGYLQAAANLGAIQTLAKPFSNQELFTAIQAALDSEKK